MTRQPDRTGISTAVPFVPNGGDRTHIDRLRPFDAPCDPDGFGQSPKNDKIHPYHAKSISSLPIDR